METEFLTEVKKSLTVLKKIQGVDGVVLSQRDGHPIESKGMWLSRSDIFATSASTSAAFRSAETLHQDQLEYVLIEGSVYKILIAPLKDGDTLQSNDTLYESNSNASEPDGVEYFLIITTRRQTNLGSIRIKMRRTLSRIQQLLDQSGADFKPPLLSYRQERIEEIFRNFALKEDGDGSANPIKQMDLMIPPDINRRIQGTVFDFAQNIPGVKSARITLDGGYSLIHYTQGISNAEDAINFTLFDIAKRLIYTLKRSSIESVMCQCKDYAQFIYQLKNGVFSTFISKNQAMGLGFLRLAIPQYIKRINQDLEQMTSPPEQALTNIRELLASFEL
jgi:predicted regulator of Ras-like GTPase activity (Roadblock/LC7/MglB family)